LVKIAWKKNQVLTVVFTTLIIIGSGGGAYWIYFDAYKGVLDEKENFQKQISMAQVKREKVPSLEKEVIKLRENVKEYVNNLTNTLE